MTKKTTKKSPSRKTKAPAKKEAATVAARSVKATAGAKEVKPARQAVGAGSAVDAKGTVAATKTTGTSGTSRGSGVFQIKLVRSLIGSSPHQRAVVAGLGASPLKPNCDAERHARDSRNGGQGAPPSRHSCLRFAMSLESLKPARGAVKSKRRIGRGPGSGWGKTAGRGHKGAKSRSGYSRRYGFEGGQMPLIRRLPKRGFVNKFAKEVSTVNVRDLERFPEGTVVTPELLQTTGLIRKLGDGLKVLGDGELKKNLVVQAQRFSATARAKIEAAGGRAEVLPT